MAILVGKCTPTYLSKTIYEELILQIHNLMRENILSEIKIGKYYSIIVGSTPDIAHIDQLVLVFRYVLLSGSTVERFFMFIYNVGYKSK